MQYKKYIKQRTGSIQGLRSFNDTLPKNIKKFINKRGHIYSETLNNWKFIAGEKLFKVCYPKFKDEVVKRIKFTSFNDENKIDNQKKIQNKPVTNNKYKNKLNDVKNEKIKNSLIELTKVFKEK